jgi:hypothetical protein
MSVQYVSDNSGRTTAVLIPIDDWNQIRKDYPAIMNMEEELPQWQKDLIDQRMMLLKQHPEQVTSLEDFLDELDKDDDKA